mmetsp:Transcript_28569/g.89369  ORF Transcript_28569/g.89369 Transcript_28569/m.89369 type:complete len:120 (-) Transcript_28569:121-480(-)
MCALTTVCMTHCMCGDVRRSATHFDTLIGIGSPDVGSEQPPTLACAQICTGLCARAHLAHKSLAPRLGAQSLRRRSLLLPLLRVALARNRAEPADEENGQDAQAHSTGRPDEGGGGGAN